jgi:hypothetical protein
MTTYVWRETGFVVKETGAAMIVRDVEAICAPFVLSDVPEYRSPINGKPITSRSHQREDLKRNDCVLAEPRKPRGFKNPNFARKRGLRTIED